MAILNPDHLFEQADRLVARPLHGPPRQVDLRRAISSAYYGLFHFVLAVVANEFVGASHHKTLRYGLVYRSLDHRTLNSVCTDTIKPTLLPKYGAYAPNGFGEDFKAFALAARELYQKRLRADYDPEPRFKTGDAAIAIKTAREAVRSFKNVPYLEQKTFFALLLFPSR